MDERYSRIRFLVFIISQNIVLHLLRLTHSSFSICWIRIRMSRIPKQHFESLSRSSHFDDGLEFVVDNHPKVFDLFVFIFFLSILRLIHTALRGSEYECWVYPTICAMHSEEIPPYGDCGVHSIIKVYMNVANRKEYWKYMFFFNFHFPPFIFLTVATIEMQWQSIHCIGAVYAQ